MGAKFRFLGTERGIVFIEDLDQGISVTNDAENVWRRVTGDYIPTHEIQRLVYKDTQGEWWEMWPIYSGYATSVTCNMEFKRWHGHVWDELNRVE
jgi:hypothetical protein